MLPSPINLSDLLDDASSNRVAPGWLYLPKDWRMWAADTPAYMIADDGHQDFDQLESEAKQRGYECTVDDQTLVDLVRAAHTYLKVNTFAGRLEALIYYHRFDAPLPQIGAPDPPPWQETKMRLDREFYDSLGAERTEVPCRSPGCNRGAVKLSVLCKVHHFEQVKRQVCPFND